jgi:hypothetical protein
VYVLLIAKPGDGTIREPEHHGNLVTDRSEERLMKIKYYNKIQYIEPHLPTKLNGDV